MKTMTCNDLGGACDLEFHAETFEEIGEMSKKHGMKMAKQGDKAHLQAMENMKKLMSEPGAMESWMKKKRGMFDGLVENAV